METRKLLGLGVRFIPTDKELLLMLKRRIELGEGGVSDFVVERNIYGIDAEPWKIFKHNDPWQEDHGSSNNTQRKRNIYVFVKLNKLSPKKISRTAGEGSWDAQTKGEKICLRKKNQNVLVGVKKLLTFQLKSKSRKRDAVQLAEKIENNRGHWNMHEYSLADPKTSDYVICRVIRSKFNEEEEESAVEEELLRPACKRLKNQEEAAEEAVDMKEFDAAAAVNFQNVSATAIVKEVGIAAAGYGVKQVSASAAVALQEVSTAAIDIQEELAAAAADPVDADEFPFAAEYFGADKDSDCAVLDEGKGCHVSHHGEEVGVTTTIRETQNWNFDLDFDFNDKLSDDDINTWVQSLLNHSPQT